MPISFTTRPTLLLSDDAGIQFWSQTQSANQRPGSHCQLCLEASGGSHAPQDYGHDGDHSDVPGLEEIQNAVGLLLLGAEVL